MWEMLAEVADEVFASPFFGFSLTLCAAVLGKSIGARIKSPFANPFVITIILIISFLLVTGIPLESYQAGGDVFMLMLIPATAMLGTTVYRQRAFLAANFLPIIVGCTVGAATSIASVCFLSRAFGLSERLMMSLLPKSVTTPIAMELAGMSGGIVSLTIASVVATGIFGVVFGPWLLGFIGLDSPITVGISLGTASHVIGTVKAIEMGETEGAASSVAICATGLMTVGIYMVFII